MKKTLIEWINEAAYSKSTFKIKGGDSEIKFNKGLLQFIQPLVSASLYCKWELVQEPVTWQEAIEAWANGKTIECRIYEDINIYKPGYVEELVDLENFAVSMEEILEGTWYIRQRNGKAENQNRNIKGDN